MIGYTLLVLVALVTVGLGAVVVGTAVWGWSQEKKSAGENTSAQALQTPQPSAAPVARVSSLSGTDIGS